MKRMGGDKTKPLKSLISLDDACEIIKSNVKPITATEEIGVGNALNRVLAESLKAKVNIPPFDRAAMDGYALKAENSFNTSTFNPKILKVIDEIHAGESSEKVIKKGQCVQIATGSPMPEGGDSVVMVEHTERENEKVNIFKPVAPGENVSRSGVDIMRGSFVLKEGEKLDASELGIIAAVGIDKIKVYEKPKVGIISTGSEIKDVGERLKYGEVYDINSYTISALVENNGGIPLRFGIVDDKKDEIEKVIKKAEGCNLVVFSGGSSVGERDILPSVVEELGQVLFHGVKTKPGKPTLCGLLGEKLILGFPGYPTSCLMNAHVFLIPTIREMARLPEKRYRKTEARISRRVTSTVGRHQFLTVKVEDNNAIPVFKEAGTITSIVDANGFIEIPENVDFLEKGDEVTVNLF